MEGLRNEMTWWQEAAQRNTHEKDKTHNKEKNKQSPGSGWEVNQGDTMGSFPQSPFFCVLG